MIYFIQCGTNGPIKIGQSDDPGARLKQLQTASPHELNLLWVYNGDDYTELEVHEKFDHESIRGEWFHPCDHLFSFIKEEMTNYYSIDFDNTEFHLVVCEEYPGKIDIEGNRFFLNILENGRVQIMPDGPNGVFVFGNKMCVDGKSYGMPKNGIRCR